MNEILFYCEVCGSRVYSHDVPPSNDLGAFVCSYCGADYAVVLVKKGEQNNEPM